MRISDWSSDVCSSDLSRWRSSWADVVDSVLTLPMVLPPTVIGYYLLVLLGRRGWLGAFLSDLGIRSEEHTSELQSLMRISYAVFCLKQKNNVRTQHEN